MIILFCKIGACDSKRPRTYSIYVALMCNLIDVEPTCFEYATNKREWMGEIIEEYHYIVKKDVWDVVPRPR